MRVSPVMRVRPIILLLVILAAVAAAPSARAGVRSRDHGTAPHVAAAVRVSRQGSVSAVIVGFRSAWVSVYPNKGSSFVARIGAATNRVIARVHVGSVPGWINGGGGMAIGLGALWVVGEQRVGGAGLEAVLERIDPTRNKLTGTIPLGGRLGADVMVHGPFVWSLISTNNASKIVKVDPATNRVVARIPLDGNAPRRIFASDGAIWVYDTQGLQGAPNGTLRRIDPSRGIVDTVPLANYEGVGVPRGHVIWIERGGDLLRLRAATGQFVGDPVHVARGIRATQMVAGDGGVWFSGYDPSHAHTHDIIHRYDPASGKVDVSVEDAHGPIAMALAPRALWVLNYDGSLSRIDLR